jgi:hypothetical protein
MSLEPLPFLEENAEGGEVLPGESRMQIDYKLCFCLLNETSWEPRSWGKETNKKIISQKFKEAWS